MATAGNPFKCKFTSNLSLEGSLAGVSSLHILGTQLTCTSWTVQTHAEITDFQCTWYMISRDSTPGPPAANLGGGIYREIQG